MKSFCSRACHSEEFPCWLLQGPCNISPTDSALYRFKYNSWNSDSQKIRSGESEACLMGEDNIRIYGLRGM